MKKLLLTFVIKAILPEILDMIWKAGHKLADKTDTDFDDNAVKAMERASDQFIEMIKDEL